MHYFETSDVLGNHSRDYVDLVFLGIVGMLLTSPKWDFAHSMSYITFCIVFFFIFRHLLVSHHHLAVQQHLRVLIVHLHLIAQVGTMHSTFYSNNYFLDGNTLYPVKPKTGFWLWKKFPNSCAFLAGYLQYQYPITCVQYLSRTLISHAPQTFLTFHYFNLALTYFVSF